MNFTEGAIVVLIFGLIPLVCCGIFRKPELDSVVIENRKTFRSDAEDGDERHASTDTTNLIKCGNRQGRIVGGREAEMGEFSYTVALMNTMGPFKYQFCGGSLITNQWVLTAAHCIHGMRNLYPISVHVGDHDLTKVNETRVQTRAVIMGKYHKHFSKATKENDIALLKLDRPVTLARNVQTICLRDTEPQVDAYATVQGWGKRGMDLLPSATLRTATVKILENEECSRQFNGTRALPITDKMICAGASSADQEDACQQDSGGPLVTHGTQIAIVSWGIGCGHYPGVYTRVNKYIDWIESNLG